jgi:glycosyltransferase involved in cell wall biosynthesis
LVVPVFNEEVRVGETFDQLASYIGGAPRGSCLIYADDGSTDRTVQLLDDRIDEIGRDGRIIVLRLPHAGKGAAVAAGLRRATTDLAAFCDVDLATPLDQLDVLFEKARTGCLAVGSRAIDRSLIGSHEGKRREYAGRAFNVLVRRMCGDIKDTQCGAKAAPTWIWHEILSFCREPGFAWDVEAIALARQFSFPVIELGVRWDHDERTTVRVVRDGLAMVTAVPRIAWRVHQAGRSRADLGYSAAIAGRQQASPQLERD